MDAAAGFGADLVAKLIHTKEQAKLHELRFGKFGRFMWSRDPGEAWQASKSCFQTRLVAQKFDGDGQHVDSYDLGSGNVQTNFVMGLMQDYVGTTNNKAAPLLANSAATYYMYTGTGTTANTYDYQLGTTDSVGSGAITPTYSQIANLTNGTDSQIQLIGTVAYSGNEAVTEWGWFNTNKQGLQINCNSTNTWNAQAQASATWNATLGAAGNLQAGSVVVIGGSVGLFVISNTSGTAGLVTGAVTPTTAYYALTAGGGVGTQPYTNYNPVGIYPLMLDHKQFAAINVVNGDSIQFTYKLRIAAGG